MINAGLIKSFRNHKTNSIIPKSIMSTDTKAMKKDAAAGSDSSLKKDSTLVQEQTKISTDEDSYLVYRAELRAHRTEHRTWSDIITIICSGCALISDGYQNNVMTMLNKVFPLIYPKVYKAALSTRLSNASIVGTIFGQLGMGICCDYLGRKWAIVTGTMFLIIGTILCAAAHGTTVEGMFWMLTCMRGAVGIGIGSEYPASSVSANEAANEATKRRGGVMVLVTNLPLSLGGPFAIIIFLIVHAICGNNHLTAIWRTMFAIGAFWPLSIFYFRMKMATGELYKKGAIQKRVPYMLVLKYCWPRLLGTCGCWFLYDFVTFPNSVFSAQIISSVLGNSKDLTKIAEWNLLLGIIAIPGIFVGAWLCDRIGRKYTLMAGFSGYLIFGLIIGCAYEKITKITALFIVFYGLMNSMANMGPGNMLGVTSSESFPTAVRGTCYGISAAVGKAGAAIGTEAFTPIRDHLGKKWTFIIAAICGVLGILIAYFFVPHLKEDDLMENDVKFQKFLLEHGWNGELGLKTDEASNSSDEENLKT